MNQKGIFAGIVIAAVSVLGGCSSIIEGTSQELVINTNPSGASCYITRQGMSIARINPTPGAATIKKTKYDIVIKCTKYGFHEASYFNKSGVAGATFGNIILGGGIGWIIDSASGADNKYTSPVNITLVPLSQARPTPIYPPSQNPKADSEKSSKPEWY